MTGSQRPILTEVNVMIIGIDMANGKDFTAIIPPKGFKRIK